MRVVPEPFLRQSSGVYARIVVHINDGGSLAEYSIQMREQHLLQNDAVLRSVHPWGCSLECDGSAGPHTPPIASGHVATRGRRQDVGLLVTATRKKTIITVGNYQRGAITDATGATFSGILQAYDAVVDFYDLLVKAEQKKQN